MWEEGGSKKSEKSKCPRKLILNDPLGGVHNLQNLFHVCGGGVQGLGFVLRVTERRKSK